MTATITYQPGAMAVELYEQSQFVTSHGWAHDRHGNCTPVLHARFGGEGADFDGFAKPFDQSDPEQATVVLNEVTGWLLARTSGLPCPQRAFFIQLPAAALPAYDGPAALPQPDGNGQLVCFATQAASNTAIRGIYDTPLLVKEQSEWVHCNSTIAFDEGIANTDRHAYNLVRRGPGDFMLIDHGYLLRDPRGPYPLHWDSGILEAMTPHAFDNLLHHNAYLAMGRTSPKACATGCEHGLAYGAALRAAVQRSMFEISFWASKLLPGTSARWLRFLYDRAHQARLADLLHRRYGLIPLQ